MTTTYEEAKHCPRCHKYGELTHTQKGQGFIDKVETWSCTTEGCPWFGTGWLIQLNKDGSIPLRKPGEKDFDNNQLLIARGKREVEDLQETVRRQEAGAE